MHCDAYTRSTQLVRYHLVVVVGVVVVAIMQVMCATVTALPHLQFAPAEAASRHMPALIIIDSERARQHTAHKHTQKKYAPHSKVYTMHARRALN